MHRHLILFLVASILGAGIGIAIGYTVFGLTYQGVYAGVRQWLLNPKLSSSVLMWVALGVISANALAYIIAIAFTKK